MVTTRQTGATLELNEQTTAGVRAFIFLAGLVPLLAPYELLIRTKWEDLFNLFFLVALFISLGALFVSAFFIFFALAAYNRRLVFDRANRSLTYGTSHVLQPYRECHYAFDQLVSVDVEAHDSSDGPQTYSLRLEARDGSRFGIGYFNDRAQVDGLRDSIADWVGVG